MVNCGVGTGITLPENEWHWLLESLQQPLTNERKACFSFLVPDTIVYQAGKPRRWYFSGRDASVLRKKNDKLENKRIYDFFTEKSKSAAAVCNQIIYSQWDEREPIKVEFKYVPFADLKKQVFSQETRHSTDLLTSYIGSYEDLPNVYIVHWTPSITNVQKLINVSKKAKNPFERISTFQGPHSLCHIQTTIAPKLTEHFNRAILEITQQIMATRNVPLRQIKLYFRFDQKHRLYLLFASHIRSDEIEDLPDLPFRPPVAQLRDVLISLHKSQFTAQKNADSLVSQVVQNSQQHQHQQSRFSLVQRRSAAENAMNTIDSSYTFEPSLPPSTPASSVTGGLGSRIPSFSRSKLGRSRPVSAKTKASASTSQYSSMLGSFGDCPICGTDFQKGNCFDLPVSTLIKLAEYHVALEARKKMELQLRPSLSTIDDDIDTVVTAISSKKLIDVYLGASHDGVPLTLMRAFPGLNCRSYAAKKANPIWLYSLVKICTECWREVKPRIYRNVKESQKQQSQTLSSTYHARRSSLSNSSNKSGHSSHKPMKQSVVMRSSEFSNMPGGGFSEHSIHEQSKEDDTQELPSPHQIPISSITPKTVNSYQRAFSHSAFKARVRPNSGKSTASTSRNQAQNQMVKELRKLSYGSAKALPKRTIYSKPPLPPQLKSNYHSFQKASFAIYRRTHASVDTTTASRRQPTASSTFLQDFDPNDMDKIAENADNLIEIITKIKEQSLQSSVTKEQSPESKRRATIAWQ